MRFEGCLVNMHIFTVYQRVAGKEAIIPLQNWFKLLPRFDNDYQYNQENRNKRIQVVHCYNSH